MRFKLKLIETVLFVLAASSTSLYALEDTIMLPDTISRIKFTLVQSQITQMTNSSGGKMPLASQLGRTVTFRDLAASQTGLRANSIPAFLQQQQMNLDDPVGSFSASSGMDMQVYGIQMNYGLTPNISIGLGVPLYVAENRVNIGFTPSAQSKRLLAMLQRPEYNQLDISRQVLAKLNQPQTEINGMLARYDYQELENWSANGFGDAVLGVKWRPYHTASLAAAFTTGVVLPTGKVDNPDILNDVGFGDGQYDIYQVVAGDWFINKNFALNGFGKYTYQSPSNRVIRLSTRDNILSAEKTKAKINLGDKYEYGSSIRYENSVGMNAAIGYQFNGKFADKYSKVSSPVANFYERDSWNKERILESSFGYSSVKAFEAKKIDIPFSIVLGYRHQLKSYNKPVAHQAQADLVVYF